MTSDPPVLYSANSTMGTRSATDTIVGIFVAFYEQKTWQQAELAQHSLQARRAKLYKPRRY